MTGRLAGVLIAAAALSGCGYVGEPLPPAMKRPMRVTDLAAVERGQKIVVQFTWPTLTTEGLPAQDESAELRIGPAEAPFKVETWERSSDRVPDVPHTKPTALVEIPAAKYQGKNIVVGVRMHGPKGRDAGWSNLVALPVVPPLPVPTGLSAKNAPGGVRLEWHAAAPEFRIFRRPQNDPNWTQMGTSGKPEYVDTVIEYGKSYEYFVQSVEKAGESYAESDVSETFAFTPKDVFPPAAPAGLTAVPGIKTIELLWDRNAEKDVAGYRVFRDGKLLGSVASPAFSDKSVKPGTTYSYEVSAMDTAGNESPRTASVSAAIP